MAARAEMEREIEIVRKRLHVLVEEKRGNFTDREVAELSCHLDQLIVQYEQLHSSRKLADKVELA